MVWNAGRFTRNPQGSRGRAALGTVRGWATVEGIP
jgi:hypothetical protein